MKAIKDMTFEDKLEQSVRFTEELGSDGSSLLIGGFLFVERMATKVKDNGILQALYAMAVNSFYTSNPAIGAAAAEMFAQIEKLFPDEFKAAFEELKAEKLQ